MGAYGHRHGELIPDEGPVLAAEDVFHNNSLGPTTADIIRKRAELSPRMLAVMHGLSFKSDTATALQGLTDGFEARLSVAMPA
jgi:hypothetical protein